MSGSDPGAGRLTIYKQYCIDYDDLVGFHYYLEPILEASSNFRELFESLKYCFW